MRNKIKKFFVRNSSKLIVGIIITVTSGAVLSRIFWQWCASFLNRCWSLLHITYSLPLWGIILFIGILLTLIIRFICSKLTNKDKPMEIKAVEVVRDGFDNLVWEFDRMTIHLDPIPICVRCNTTIPINGPNQRMFECPSCHCRIGTLKTYKDLYNLAKPEFERRNKNWNQSEASNRIRLIREKLKW